MRKIAIGVVVMALASPVRAEAPKKLKTSFIFSVNGTTYNENLTAPAQVFMPSGAPWICNRMPVALDGHVMTGAFTCFVNPGSGVGALVSADCDTEKLNTRTKDIMLSWHDSSGKTQSVSLVVSCLTVSG